MNFQRDTLISEIYNHAKKNKNIYFLSADFGAPALDKFRKDLKNQFYLLESLSHHNQNKLLFDY